MEEKNNFALKLDNVSKKYIFHHQKPTLIENILRLGKKEEFWALKNVNLEVKEGEKLGIIGPNGAGKSTLLKIISGITNPTQGKVEVKGKIASLIELTAGFYPDLTGEENIFINGLLLGMNRKEIKSKFKKIVNFSEIQHFIDAPFYTYSDGMKLRLGFSIALYSDPDILIVDEILSTGDEYFQEKCQKKIKEVFRQKTILFVAHDLVLVKNICPNSILLEKGKIKAYGQTQKIIKNYIKSI